MTNDARGKLLAEFAMEADIAMAERMIGLMKEEPCLFYALALREAAGSIYFAQMAKQEAAEAVALAKEMSP